MNRRSIGIAVAIVCLIGAIALTAWLMRPAERRTIVVPVDPNAGWEAAYAKATSNLGPMEQTTLDRQKFVDAYPKSPGTLVVLNQLGDLYARQNRFAESIRAFEAARQLARDHVPSQPGLHVAPGVLDVNLAQTYRMSKRFDEAQKLLIEVMRRSLPATADVDTYVPQVFLAPLEMADVCHDRGEERDADQLRKETAERAMVLAKRHPQADWIPSYAAWAYYQRINARLDRTPPDLAEARALAEEFNQRMPNYAGNLGYPSMIQAVSAVEARPKP